MFAAHGMRAVAAAAVGGLFLIAGCTGATDNDAAEPTVDPSPSPIVTLVPEPAITAKPTPEPRTKPSPEPTSAESPLPPAASPTSEPPPSTSVAPAPAQSAAARAPSAPRAQESNSRSLAEEQAPQFDAEWARTNARNIVEDIAAADERMLDRPEIGGSTTMWFLADNMDRLMDAGVPPGEDPAQYMALLQTLGDFYTLAGDQLPGDVMGAAATYTVARENTSTLLDILNSALGTSHSLPPWSF